MVCLEVGISLREQINIIIIIIVVRNKKRRRKKTTQTEAVPPAAAGSQKPEQVQDTIAICPAVCSQKAALAALNTGRGWVPGSPAALPRWVGGKAGEAP